MKETNPDNIRLVMDKVNRKVVTSGNPVNPLDLFDLAVDLLREIPNLPEAAAPVVEAPIPKTHDEAVQWAVRNDEVIALIADNKTINAIKLVREGTLFGLKEAKAVVLDYRVQDAVHMADSWRHNFTV